MPLLPSVLSVSLYRIVLQQNMVGQCCTSHVWHVKSVCPATIAYSTCIYVGMFPSHFNCLSCHHGMAGALCTVMNCISTVSVLQYNVCVAMCMSRGWGIVYRMNHNYTAVQHLCWHVPDTWLGHCAPYSTAVRPR